MSFGLWPAVVRTGLAASRETAPDVPAGTFSFYYATDTKELSIYSVANGWQTQVSGAPVNVGASLAATLGANKTYLLNAVAGSVLTLPAATGSGNRLTAIVSATLTSAAHKILTSPITDLLVGQAIGSVAAGTALKFNADASGTFHSLQMPFAGTQPSGGFEGDIFRLTDLAAGKWHVEAMYKSGTTSTTPFSTATT